MMRFKKTKKTVEELREMVKKYQNPEISQKEKRRVENQLVQELGFYSFLGVVKMAGTSNLDEEAKAVALLGLSKAIAVADTSLEAFGIKRMVLVHAQGEYKEHLRRMATSWKTSKGKRWKEDVSNARETMVRVSNYTEDGSDVFENVEASETFQQKDFEMRQDKDFYGMFWNKALKMFEEDVLDTRKPEMKERNLKIFQDRVFKKKTLVDLGEEYGMSRERVRQIHESTRKRIQKLLEKEGHTFDSIFNQ